MDSLLINKPKVNCKTLFCFSGVVSSSLLAFPANQRGMSHTPVREQTEQHNSRVFAEGEPQLQSRLVALNV